MAGGGSCNRQFRVSPMTRALRVVECLAVLQPLLVRTVLRAAEPGVPIGGVRPVGVGQALRAHVIGGCPAGVPAAWALGETRAARKRRKQDAKRRRSRNRVDRLRSEDIAFHHISPRVVATAGRTAPISDAEA